MFEMGQHRILIIIVGLVFFLQLLVSSVTLSSANDTIVEITPQGLQFKTEDNISIEKESLYISLRKIEVSYIFRNHSSKNITAEVAFPVPPYQIHGFIMGNHSHKPINFGDFKVEVNNAQTSYKKELRALVNARNYAPLI
jgi:hypothetical protein